MLLTALKQVLKVGTTIYFRLLALTNQSQIHKTHGTVNHTHKFVDTVTRVDTQHIKSLWGLA